MQGDEDKSNTHQKGRKQTIRYDLNPSSQLLFEDALKRCLNKYGGKKVPLKSPYAPPLHNSPFGDFPRSYLPKKNSDYNLVNIENHQIANSVSNFPDSKRKKVATTTAFSSLDKPTTDKPPKAGAFRPRKIPVSDFRLHYDRGDLPVLVKHERGTTIKWKDESFDKFNYQLYLPIFVDGIREVADPYRFIAIRGTFDLLDHVKDNIVKIIPQLILPLKTALNTRDVDIIAVALKVIQKLVTCSDLAGEALVPYYRQLLPIFNLYRNFNHNLGDEFEYGQRKKKTLGDLIQETLEKMELNGGDDAFINIKYMIPTYESCVYDIRG
jgi:hypothetical protein